MQDTPIEIFRTNISRKRTADKILKELNSLFPNSEINFDLDDCDKILRLEGVDFSVKKVVDTIIGLGYECEII